MDITLTTTENNGQDGRELDSNPNHNLLTDVIPTMVSRQLYDNLYKYKQYETKLTKLEHHIEFFKPASNKEVSLSVSNGTLP